MAFLSSIFKKSFKEQVGSIEEREIGEVVTAADNIFISEKKEKKLFSEEITKIEIILWTIKKLVKASAKAHTFKLDPNLRLLNEMFLYLRSHTIDKLNYLRRIHRDAAIIVSEAEHCEEYDKILRKVIGKGFVSASHKKLLGKNELAALQRKALRKKRDALKEALADIDSILLAMRDIERKEEDINQAMNIMESNTRNMLKILKGEPTDEMGLGKVNLPALLNGLKSYYPLSSTASPVINIQKKIIGLKEVLEEELGAFSLFYEDIRSIKRRAEKIRRLIKETKLKVSY